MCILPPSWWKICGCVIQCWRVSIMLSINVKNNWTSNHGIIVRCKKNYTPPPHDWNHGTNEEHPNTLQWPSRLWSLFHLLISNGTQLYKYDVVSSSFIHWSCLGFILDYNTLQSSTCCRFYLWPQCIVTFSLIEKI